jgi:NADH dehydrogenase
MAHVKKDYDEMKTDWDIVIVGGGFAGLACARYFEKAWGPEARHRVLLLSAENYFLYQPFLPEVIGGSVEPRHVINPLRTLLRWCHIQRGTVTNIDPQHRRIEFRGRDERVEEPITADHIVLALGNVTNLNAVPGMLEHGLFFKTLADALQLRERIICRLEEASLEAHTDTRKALLQFVIVGGGYSGVETAGEIFDLLQSAKQFYPDLDSRELHVTLIHSGSRLFPDLDPEFGTFAQHTLEDRGVEVWLNNRMKAVSAHAVHFEHSRAIQTRNVICTIGNDCHPLLRDLKVERKGKYIATNAHLQLQDFPWIWAIGDTAANPDGDGKFCPPTAQAAVQQGQHAAKNILRNLQGKSLHPFRFRKLGHVATLGHHNGVCIIGGFRIRGLFAWWLTESSPKLVEILHDSSVDITRPSSRVSFFHSVPVAGLHASVVSADSPSLCAAVARYPAMPWPTSVVADWSLSIDRPWHTVLPPTH